MQSRDSENPQGTPDDNFDGVLTGEDVTLEETAAVTADDIVGGLQFNRHDLGNDLTDNGATTAVETVVETQPETAPPAPQSPFTTVEVAESAAVDWDAVADEIPDEIPPTKYKVSEFNESDYLNESGATPAEVDPTVPETIAERVEYSNAEDLTEATDVLDTAFTAPGRTNVPVAAQDVLGSRSKAREAAPSPEETIVQETETTETLADTGIIRRSLVTTAIETEPEVAETPAETITRGEEFDNHLLEGATVKPEVPSRAGARWLSAIGTLLLTPLAWYLLVDSGARLFIADNNPWSTGTINAAALAELGGGILVVLVIGILASLSSLGLLLTGIVTLVVGIPFLAAPEWTADTVLRGFESVTSEWGVLFDNALFHLEFTGATGILTMLGAGMLIGAWVTWRMRRKGRAEEALRVDVAAVNPDGLKARWARKATERQVSPY